LCFTLSGAAFPVPPIEPPSECAARSATEGHLWNSLFHTTELISIDGSTRPLLGVLTQELFEVKPEVEIDWKSAIGSMEFSLVESACLVH
jgi:hypothetical protein